MGALKNQRQERFCQLIKRGIPPYRAYPLAGYNPDNGAPYRLSENVRVKARLRELTKGFAMKTRVTVETISAQLDEDRAFAVEVKQAGPALNATIAKAKLHGLIVDRKESGAPGEFATLATEAEVMDAVRRELGDAAAEALVASLVTPEPDVEQQAEVEQRDPNATLN
jgi:hypothetical protein